MIPGWQMEAYERLRTEIVRSAVFDYKKDLRKSEKLGVICGEQKKLERWFLSKWGQMLTGDNGRYIIEKCRQSYKISTPYARYASNAEKKKGIAEDVQKRIYEDYRNGVRYKAIIQKYGISTTKLYDIVRRWDK
jgi:hypothetical protein